MGESRDGAAERSIRMTRERRNGFAGPGEARLARRRGTAATSRGGPQKGCGADRCAAPAATDGLVGAQHVISGRYDWPRSCPFRRHNTVVRGGGNFPGRASRRKAGGRSSKRPPRLFYTFSPGCSRGTRIEEKRVSDCAAPTIDTAVDARLAWRPLRRVGGSIFGPTAMQHWGRLQVWTSRLHGRTTETQGRSPVDFDWAPKNPFGTS